MTSSGSDGFLVAGRKIEKLQRWMLLCNNGDIIDF